ncbi:MAG: hypothetical protein ACC654_03300, partial [Acidimicrobiia bacterium]
MMGSQGEDTEQRRDGPPAAPTLAPERKRRPWWHQAISVATTVVVLVVVFGFVIPNLADYRDVLDSVGAISISSWLMIGSTALLFL